MGFDGPTAGCIDKVCPVFFKISAREPVAPRWALTERPEVEPGSRTREWSGVPRYRYAEVPVDDRGIYTIRNNCFYPIG